MSNCIDCIPCENPYSNTQCHDILSLNCITNGVFEKECLDIVLEDGLKVVLEKLSSAVCSLSNGEGTGYEGLMSKSIYDPNGDGKVNSSVNADIVPWAGITGKPSTYPATAHTHSIANITGLQSALDSKQPAGSYAASSHTHSISQVIDLQTRLNEKQATLISGTNLKTINGISLLGSGNLNISGGSGSITVDQLIISGSTNAVSGDAVYQALLAKASTVHTHAIADVTNLQTTLNGKAATVHTHTKSQISDFAHTHLATEITLSSTHRFVSDTEKATWNAKQSALVSGTNIKTINGVSILGSGDIPIAGSGSVGTLQQVTTTGNTTSTDIEITDTTKGIILKSPNNQRWRVTIGNDGALITTTI